VTARRWDRVGLGAAGLGGAFRLLFGLVLHPPLHYEYSDMADYVSRAALAAKHAPLAHYDAYHPPGTYLLLQVPFRLFGTRHTGHWAATVLWAALSALAPLFMWLFARRLLTPAAAAIATALVAFWPLHVTLGGFFLSETPAITLLLLTLWLLALSSQTEGRRAIALGVAAGLAAAAVLAVRPQLVLNLFIGVLPLLFAWRRQRRWWAGAAVGIAFPLAFVLALNASAAGHFAGLSENDGVNFFYGHCHIAFVHAGHPGGEQVGFSSPVNAQLHRGHDVSFPDREIGDQAFFFRKGLDCIRHDGIGHIGRELSNVNDMLATSVPWPMANEQHLRWFVVPANDLLSLSLIAIVIGAIALIRRRPARWRSSEALLLAHLLCFLPTALVFIGEPRYRSPYDLFALALVGSLVNESLGRWNSRGRVASNMPANEANNNQLSSSSNE